MKILRLQIGTFQIKCVRKSKSEFDNKCEKCKVRKSMAHSLFYCIANGFIPIPYSLAHLKSDININQLSKAKQKPMANRFECVQYIYLVWACSLPSRSYPLGKPLTTFIWKARASDHSHSLPISLHPITVWSGLQMIMAPENEIQKLPQCTSFRF